MTTIEKGPAADVSEPASDDETPAPVDDRVAVAFARAFLETVVTPERGAQMVAGLVGPVVRFGPVPVGPHGMATATAEGDRGQVCGYRCFDAGAFVVSVAVALRIRVCVGERTLPAGADLRVRVRLRPSLAVRPTPAVTVEVDPVEDRDIDVDSHTSGVAGVFLRRVGDLDGEIRTHVRRWVTELLDTDPARAARRIDIVGVVDRAFDHGLVLATPPSPPGESDGCT